MKKSQLFFVLGALALSSAAYADVCLRSLPVVSALKTATKLNCDQIGDAELLTITDLELPHQHIRLFQDEDFVGLTNLKRLRFFSLLHNPGQPSSPVTLRAQVFAPLVNLEELIMEEQLGLLPDDVFAPLVSLKVLDLSNGTLNRLPLSILSIPRIEQVYFDGDGLSDPDFTLLSNTLGAKLKPTRL